MNLESWAAFGPTSAIWPDETITGLVPYLVGHQPTETLVAIGLKDGRPALTATRPLDRLPDQAAYADCLDAWLPLCNRLYLLVYTENTEVRYEASAALFLEDKREIDYPDDYETIAVSSRGQCDLDYFDPVRDEDDYPPDSDWAPVHCPHPALARLFALDWHRQLDPARRLGTSLAPALEEQWWKRVRIGDPNPTVAASYPDRHFGADLMCAAWEIGRALNVIWLGDDPAALDLAYWRTTGRDRQTGTAQALAAAICAFASWRWGRPEAAQAAVDAVEADPDCVIAQAVARLVSSGVQASALRQAPYLIGDGPAYYRGPTVPMLDGVLHGAVRRMLTDALEQAPDPVGDRFAATIRTVAICGTPDQLHLHDLDWGQPRLKALEWLTDQANADPERYSIEGLRGVATLRARKDGYRTADAVLLDGSGQRYFRYDRCARPSWNAWSTAAPDIDRGDPDRLHRLAHALHRAGID